MMDPCFLNIVHCTACTHSATKKVNWLADVVAADMHIVIQALPWPPPCLVHVNCTCPICLSPLATLSNLKRHLRLHVKKRKGLHKASTTNAIEEKNDSIRVKGLNDGRDKHWRNLTCPASFRWWLHGQRRPASYPQHRWWSGWSNSPSFLLLS